jgi:hypothetical protein
VLTSRIIVAIAKSDRRERACLAFGFGISTLIFILFGVLLPNPAPHASGVLILMGTALTAIMIISIASVEPQKPAPGLAPEEKKEVRVKKSVTQSAHPLADEQLDRYPN